MEGGREGGENKKRFKRKKYKTHADGENKGGESIWKPSTDREGEGSEKVDREKGVRRVWGDARQREKDGQASFQGKKNPPPVRGRGLGNTTRGYSHRGTGRGCKNLHKRFTGTRMIFGGRG